VVVVLGIEGEFRHEVLKSIINDVWIPRAGSIDKLLVKSKSV
jgi:hypothetical protein